MKDVYQNVSMAVQVAKKICNIPNENRDLTDDQIAEICRFIASFAPDNTTEDGKIKYGEIGISLMLSIALYVFPWFYSKYQLWQRN